MKSGFGLIIDWRLDGISRNFAEIYNRYIGPYPCPATKPLEEVPFMMLTICEHHMDDDTREGKDKIRNWQKKCPNYPKPNFFLDG